jgi:hypothetical protein
MLTQNGKSSYVIVLAGDAIPAEKTAAQQLQVHLQKVTGATLPIKNQSEVTAASPQILVGAGTRVKGLLPQQNWSALGTDGIVIKTVGKNLILAGGRPRGALYAVFEFLEKSVGVRWWTPTESTIPKKSTLQVLTQNTVYTPQILTRELFMTGITRDRWRFPIDPNVPEQDPMQTPGPDVRYTPLFVTQMKINGHYQTQGPELGGHNSILGFVHTFDQLLPPEKYFKAHPEWYTDPANGNKPSTATTPMPREQHVQLDLTNDEMRAELTKVALQWIAKNPEAGMISISQNDNQNYSRSPGDMAIIEREGSPAGVLLHFVNQVAADIEKVYPNFLVETLAYQHTRKPPRTVRPRKNVVIRLCPIEGDFARPLNSDANASFRDDVLGWKAIAPRLYIWDYVTNFHNSVFPHPNFRVLGPNVRFFAANNVIGLFEQGDGYSNGTGDFPQLRAWLLSHLLWNPQQDENKLIDEFMNGYYGAAAPHLRTYLNEIQDAFLATGKPLRTLNSYQDYLTLPVMNRATTLFAAAQKAVANDAVLARRVRRARLPLDHAWILRYNALKRQERDTKQEFLGPTDAVAFTEDFITTAQGFGLDEYREGQFFADYIPQLRARVVLRSPAAPLVPLPVELQQKVPPGSAARNVIDSQQGDFRISPERHWVSLVDDAQASDKKAARMAGNHKQWSVQYPLNVDAAGDAWHLYVVARIQSKAGAPKTGTALDYGIYDTEKNTAVTTRSKTVAEMGNDDYHVLDLGVHAPNSEAYIWVAPTNNPNVEAVFVDRIVWLREPISAQP